MAKKSKQLRAALEKIDSTKAYSVEEAVALAKETNFAKFDATVEVSYNLNIDVKKADQQIRGAMVLPNGTGKTQRVLVFARGAKAEEAKAAGADFVGEDDLVAKINDGWLDFDVVIATPDMMALVGRLGRVLGPRNLMPNPKTGTVTMDVAKAVEESKGGKITYRADKAGNVQAIIGKVSFEAEKLVENNDIAGAFKQLQLLHSRWKEIGPIPKEQKEPLWERFKAATSQINEKYHHFFESLKQEQEDNLKVKEEICGKAAAIAAGEYRSISEWNTATQNIIDLQEEWKHSGTIPQKERNKIYKKFRSSCDTFFERKRDFYKNMSAEQDKNLELKIKLCEKVEAIKDSTDWKITTDRIISYQKEWKKIGPAPKKYSNKVWARFREACDTFFNNKKLHFKDIDSEQSKNLELKKAIIEEARQFTLSGNAEEDINKLKDFQNRWAEIGFVPIKYKDAIQEEFRHLIDGWFDQLNLDEYDRDLERFRAKLSSLDAGDYKDYKIINEREKLVAKIRQLELDVNTYENNIGFIAKSSKSQGLIEELNSKSENTRQRLNLLQEKLKALDSLI